MNTHTNTASPRTLPFVKLSELATAQLVAVTFAAAMLFTVGFAQSASVHNAAHDTRHVQVFPCH